METDFENEKFFTESNYFINEINEENKENKENKENNKYKKFNKFYLPKCNDKQITGNEIELNKNILNNTDKIYSFEIKKI